MFTPEEFKSEMNMYDDCCYDFDQVALDMFNDLISDPDDNMQALLTDVCAHQPHTKHDEDDASSFSDHSTNLGTTSNTLSDSLQTPHLSSPDETIIVGEQAYGQGSDENTGVAGQGLEGMMQTAGMERPLLSQLSAPLQVTFIPTDQLLQLQPGNLLNLGNNPMLLFQAVQGKTDRFLQQIGPRVCSREERQKKLERYRQKKQNRKSLPNQVRYPLRKKNADNRPRIKGRFVKQVVDSNKKRKRSNTESSDTVLPSSPGDDSVQTDELSESK